MRLLSALIASLMLVTSAFGACNNTGLCMRLDNGTEGPLPPTVFLTQLDALQQAKGPSLYSTIGHVNWSVYQPSLNYQSQEFQVYPTFATGKASAAGGNGIITYVSGTPFDTAWAGRNLFYFCNTGFPCGQYKVASVNGTSITLQTVGGGAVSLSNVASANFKFGGAITDAVCNVNGTTVTWVSGQQFHPVMGFGNGGLLTVNGVAVTQTGYTSGTQIAINTNLGTLQNVACHSDSNINNEVTTLRVQSVFGADEENLTITSSALGYNFINAQVAGNGVYGPVAIGSGACGSNLCEQFIANVDGSASVGGLVETDVFRVQNAQGVVTNYIWAPFATAGQSVSLAARANTTDTNVDFTIDTFGSGQTLFTSHSFANLEFAVEAGGSSSYVATGSNAGDPYLAARSATNTTINLDLFSKGFGAVKISNHLAGFGAAPTVTGGCGAGPSLSTGANDIHGTLTTGTGSFSSCTLTFANVHANTSDCLVLPLAGGSAPVITTAAGTLIINTSAASAKYVYHCLGL